MFPSRGNLNPLTISPEGGIYLRIELEKLIWNYLSSKSGCKDYNSDDEEKGFSSSYMKCLLEKQIDCYKLNAPSKGCKCIPENTFKTHFEIYNPMMSKWNMCETNSEYKICRKAMMKCYRQILYSKPRVVYDRVRKKKNYFEIPAFLQIERGKSRVGKFKTSNENINIFVFI